MSKKKWEGKAFYQVLGVAETASIQEIKSQYRWLARKFHPDQNDNDERAVKSFLLISEAYEVLSNAEQRQAYDSFLKSQRADKARTTENFSNSNSQERKQNSPKPPYRQGNTGNPKPTPKPPPQSSNQGSSGDNSKYKGQAAPKNQFDDKGSGCLPALATIVGLLVLFILIAVATSSNTTSTVGQTSEVEPPQTVEPENNYAQEDFCGMVFRDDRTFESKQDIYAFWSKLDNGLDKLTNSASLVKVRGETLLSRTIDLANSWDSQSENAWQASWESYVQAEGSLAEQCGFTLQ